MKNALTMNPPARTKGEWIALDAEEVVYFSAIDETLTVNVTLRGNSVSQAFTFGHRELYEAFRDRLFGMFNQRRPVSPAETPDGGGRE